MKRGEIEMVNIGDKFDHRTSGQIIEIVGEADNDWLVVYHIKNGENISDALFKGELEEMLSCGYAVRIA